MSVCFIRGLRMKGTPAIYLDRIVEKKHFRAFIYGADGEKKLVESWDEFEAAMQSGIWFATPKDVQEKPKPKSRSKAKSKIETVTDSEESGNVIPEDGSVFEVKDGS